MRTFEAADLFCGAGGTSEGMKLAAADEGVRLKLTAVNHWQIAVDTHTANHPDAKAHPGSLSTIEPHVLIPSRHLDGLVASPECTHHSRARGGKPMSDQSRAGAWCVIDWLSSLTVEELLIENVVEFEEWGPLGADGHPLKSRKGETFNAFCRAIESLNYSLDIRRLVAADFGDATTRERLFIRARRCRRKIQWPCPSHSRDGAADLFDGPQRARWRPAREIIDWSIKGKSIFQRKWPLKPNTLARIEAGIKKFWGKWAEPFLIILRNHQNAQSIDGPVPTICTSGAHVGLVQPFIVPQMSGGACRGVNDKPVPTITTTSRGIGLVEPFIFPLNHGRGDLRSRPVSEPMPTLTTLDAWGIAQPFVMSCNHGGGIERRVHDVTKPLPTLACSNQFAAVEPFIIQYNGTGVPQAIGEPLNTVTTRDRFGIVWGDYVLDILFRMLTPHELAAAMGFPKSYFFAGTREEKVKQIGNAVPVNLARALCRGMVAA